MFMRSNSIQASTAWDMLRQFKLHKSQNVLKCEMCVNKGLSVANAKQLFHLVKFSSWLSQAHSQGVAYSQMAPCCTKNLILRWAASIDGHIAPKLIQAARAI